MEENQRSNSFNLSKHTHFGFRSVDEGEKTKLVGEVFQSVASRYDMMNDLMSLGMHRLWKRFAVSQSGLRPGDRVLDIAGGSGDLSRLFVKQIGQQGTVILSDINMSMLMRGKENLINSGIVGNIQYVIVNAENICFIDNYFHCISISFGLRNVTRKEMALESMYRAIKPGGRLIVLDFSKPILSCLKHAYDFYSFSIIPKLGKLIVNDQKSYTYLVESIRQHPDQQHLKRMILKSGFNEVKIYNLSGGIVALHLCFKY